MNGEQLLVDLAARICAELSSRFRARGDPFSAKVDSVAESLTVALLAGLRLFALAADEDSCHRATLKTYDFGNGLLRWLRDDAPGKPASKGFEWVRTAWNGVRAVLGMELRARA